MSTPWMSLSLPTVSVTAGPQWAQSINDALSTVDRHDHSPGLGKLIRSASLSIDADVSWGGYNLTNLRSVRLANQSVALSGLTDVGCVFESGGDLYYRNASGQNVQVTSGSGLNASSVGAIGGDFVTSGAAVTYLSASKSFIFTQATNQAASLDAGNVILREPGVSSAKGVTLQSPSALAADYNLILPAAVPAATLPLVMAASGQVSAMVLTSAQVGPITTSWIDSNFANQIGIATGSITWGTNYSGTYRLTRTGNGIVVFNATIARAVGAGTVALTLPVGFRPGFALRVMVACPTAGTSYPGTIGTNGQVSLDDSSTISGFGLNVTFLAEN